MRVRCPACKCEFNELYLCRRETGREYVEEGDEYCPVCGNSKGLMYVETEMLNCPICGSDGEMDTANNGGPYYENICYCSNPDCPMVGSEEWFCFEDEAIEDWNRAVMETFRHDRRSQLYQAVRHYRREKGE